MSEDPKGPDTSVEEKKVIPDFFGYYTREVAELLSQNNDSDGKEENISVDSGSLFCDPIGDGVSDTNKERLKQLLRQSVVALTGEVDEMVDPVLGIRRIQSCLSAKKTSPSSAGATTEGDALQHDHKRRKLPSSSFSVSPPLVAGPTRCTSNGKGYGNEDMDVTAREKGVSNLVTNQCYNCHTTKTPMWRKGPEGIKLCNACGIRIKKGKESLQIKDPMEESFLGLKIEENVKGNDNEDMDVTVPEKGISNFAKNQCYNCHTTESPMWRKGPEGTMLCNACGIRFKKDKNSLQIKDPMEESFLDFKEESVEANDDLQFLLHNNDSTVMKTVEKYSDELYATLEHMEQKIEELLNTVVSTCRPLKHAEKIELRKSIENLPPRNLDRVMEIIGRGKPTEKYSGDEIHVDLENEDNVTLWRLYFYVQTVENARDLFESN